MKRINEILIAVDSFKGSVSAEAACRAIAEGIAELNSRITCTHLPMADGGEGTVEALVSATGGRIERLAATGPLGEPVEAFFGLLGDGKTAAVEMAAASGLPLVPDEKRNPLYTTSYGTGELIAAALGAGIEKLIVCIGGSATTDLGCGMVQALGASFFDAAGHEITRPMTGYLLSDVTEIRLDGLDERIARCEIEVACDVTNPLLGESGAAAVFGPQKGASPADVAVLERNLTHMADVLERRIGRRVRDLPGAGAAGGLGAALAGVLGATLRGGIQIVLEAAKFTDKLATADLVITGEGRIDATTLHGKTIAGICAAARQAGKPVLALAGRVADREKLGALGLIDARAIAPDDMPTAEAMRRGTELLKTAATRVVGALIDSNGAS